VGDVAEFMTDLALDPERLAEYLRDPARGLARSGIPDEEQRALRTGRAGDLWHLLIRGEAPDTTVAPEEPPQFRPDGQLVVVGTGIRTVGQLTVEAIAWMRDAEALLYLVADPITEDTLRRLNPTALSLRGYYGEGEGRLGSYEAMVQHILSCVRSGKRTCAAFYGHPGVFAYPSHESVRRARADGYLAFMLPAVSAEDCLFADLGIDPSLNGMQSYEASDFLLHERTIDTSAQLVLWQVGVVGDFTFRGEGYDLSGFPLLVQRLAEFYPLWHEIVLYEASLFLGYPPTITRMQLAQLTSDYVNAATTMYVAPARATSPNVRMQQSLRQMQSVP
jgi:hypothetical protein